MAGYVKVWTTISDNDKFLSLSLIQRGAYLQLLISAKKGRDDGTIYYRDWTALGSDWGCDRKTSGKILGILQEKSLCTYTQNSDGVIQVEITNYKRWQEIDVKGVREKPRKSPGKIPPLRAKQSKAKHTIAEHTSADKPPVEQIRNLYIEICQGFPEPTEVLDWSPKRKGNVNARWRQHPDIDWWRTYFERIAASDFLRNGNEKWAGADLGWVILPSNMEKILEGRYDKKKRKTEKKDDRPTGEFE